MTRTEARQLLDENMSEAQFQRDVIDLAHLCGWKVLHIHDSRRSTGAGYPDLTLVHPRRGVAYVAELKSERGSITGPQGEWLEAWKRAGVAAFVWRPGDWDEIERVLR